MIVPARRAIRMFLPLLVAIAVASPAAAQADGWRTIEFQTTQVTAPDVAVSPDGEWLIFGMLGKLFRLPVKGGEAEQLTFGPYYDDDPAISPDGKLVAFQSDRDGSEGNIFVLTLAGGAIIQLTHESWADNPTWARDGQALVYLRFERDAWNPADSLPRPPAVVRRVRLAGGEPETLRALGEVASPFHLPDGRVGWAIVERDTTSPRRTTRIEVRDGDGRVSTLRVLEGVADRVVASPRADGLYARTADVVYPRYHGWEVQPLQNDVLFAPLPGGRERRFASVSSEGKGFAVASDNTALYLGNLGHLWKITLPNIRREAIAFRARVTLAIREPVAPPAWTPLAPGATAPVRTIQQPRLSPDGSRVVFRALNRLWQQPLVGGQSHRLVVDSAGTERDPAFSPDGRHLAFVRGAQGNEEIQVLDLQSGKRRTVGPPVECGQQLTWSLHGELISTSCDNQVIAIEPTAGTVRVLAPTSEGWDPYPQLSADGETLYFRAGFPGSNPSFYRLRLKAPGKPEPLLPVAADGIPVWVSTNEQWVALPVQNRPGIRLAALARGGIAQANVRLVSAADGHEFSFTPDGSALLYVAGNSLWREPLTGGAPREIPIRLAPRAPTPPPVLLQRVRVLDFAAGGFSTETSILIEHGRIQWIGRADGRELPGGTVTVDAGGRFAIPGLFDMHGHYDWCGRPAYVAYGVTSVRNMGGRLEERNAQADQSDFTSDPVSRCFYTGRILEGPSGWNGDVFVHLFDEEDARTHVRLSKAQGAQFIKVYNLLPWPVQRAVAEEARRVGLPVWAHGFTLEQVVKGVTLGYGGLTHWHRFYGFYDDALQMFAAAGTRWDPTLGVLGGVELSFRDEPERFQIEEFEPWRLLGDKALRGDWVERLRAMRAAYRRGITFLPGTDGNGLPDGVALHWELEFFAEAGIPPLDILRFATQASAETVGAQDHLGTLEVGKLADLVLLDANPLDDIKNTRAIWRVIKGGWVFDPKMLLPDPN